MYGLTLQDQDPILLGNLQNLQLSFPSSGTSRWVASDRVTADRQLCNYAGRWTYYMTLGRSLSAGQFSNTCSSALDDIPRLSTPTSAHQHSSIRIDGVHTDHLGVDDLQIR